MGRRNLGEWSAFIVLVSQKWNGAPFPAAYANATAMQAQESFARAGHQESEWRAWLLAARACQRAGDGSKVREYASRADASLSNLKKTWRLEAANGYIKRPDIQESHKHLRQLMAENR